MAFTTHLLFNDENNPLADILISIAVKYPSDRSSKSTLELLLYLLVLEDFREKMITSYVRAYCTLPNFDNSRFEILFGQLMAHPK